MSWELTDGYGNMLSITSGKPSKIRLWLKGKRPKTIGQVDLVNKILYVKRNSARHYHYKSKCYGFNAELLNSLELTHVRLTIDKEHFQIPIDAFKYARHLNFSQQGFELQKFLPVEIIRQYAVQPM